MCFKTVFLLLVSVLAYADALPFYKTPSDTWKHLEGEAISECLSDMQSPINIITENVRCDASQSLIRPLVLNDYNHDTQFNFSNSKATILAKLNGNNAGFSFRGSGIPEMLSPFQLAQFHFHWGQDNTEGSEHVIDNVNAPLELHLVHVSSKDPKYFAVIGILFELTSKPNANLDSIIQAADVLSSFTNESLIQTVNLAKLLPPNLDRFFYYEGSLTTPPCTERVFWTVMADKIPIGVEQLKYIHANPLKVNFRPPQPINERFVATIDCTLANNNNDSRKLKEKQSLIKESY